MKFKKTRLRVLFVISTLFAITLSFTKFREQLHQGYLKWNKSADIIMFGDSHTIYGKWNTTIDQHTVVKYAWGGYTSEMLVNKISLTIPFKPKYVFILCGGNDIYNESFSVQKTLHNFKLMADTLRNNNITPVFQKLMYKHDDSEFNATIDLINSALTDYCYKEQIDIIDIGKDMYDITGLKASLTFDDLHLNEKGYVIWNKTINDYLKSH